MRKIRRFLAELALHRARICVLDALQGYSFFPVGSYGYRMATVAKNEARFWVSVAKALDPKRSES